MSENIDYEKFYNLESYLFKDISEFSQSDVTKKKRKVRIKNPNQSKKKLKEFLNLKGISFHLKETSCTNF